MNFNLDAKGFFAFLGLVFFVFNATPASAQTSCLGFQSGSASVSGYGVSWDVYDSLKPLLIKTNCPTSGSTLTLTIGKGDPTQLVHTISYVYIGGWQPYTLSGLISSEAWLKGVGTTSIAAPAATSASNPLYIVGYVCQLHESVWKCGCSDTACSTGKWQLQSYRGNGSGGSTTGGGTGGGDSTTPADPPAQGHTVPVSTASELSSALANAQPGDHITLASGAYTGTFTLSRSGTKENPIVIKAAVKNAAVINGTLQMRSAYTWVHGLKFTGLTSGIDINASNVTVTRSWFTGARGISVSTGDQYVKIGYNKFTTIVEDVPGSNLTHDSDIYIDVDTNNMPEHGRIYRNYFTTSQDQGGGETHNIYAGPDGGAPPNFPSFTDFVVEYNLIENSDRQRGIYFKRAATLQFNQIDNCPKCNFGFRTGKGGKIYGNRLNNIRSFIVNGPDHDIRGNIVNGADMELFADTLSTGDNKYVSADNALLVGNTASIRVGVNLNQLLKSVRGVRICRNSGAVRLESQQGTVQQTSCSESVPQTVSLTASQVGPDAQ